LARARQNTVYPLIATKLVDEVDGECVVKVMPLIWFDTADTCVIEHRHS
jgi:hypothetical protein